MASVTVTVWEEDDPMGGVALFQYTYDDTPPASGGTGPITGIGYQNESQRSCFISITNPSTQQEVHGWHWTVGTNTPLNTQDITSMNLKMIWQTGAKTGVSCWVAPYGYYVRWPA